MYFIVTVFEYMEEECRQSNLLCDYCDYLWFIFGLLHEVGTKSVTLGQSSQMLIWILFLIAQLLYF